jgi:hypothetical protein
MTERELQSAVIQLARLFGWRVAHFRPAITSKGWRTPVEADGAGFPDLVLARDRILYAELKSDRGRLTEAQLEWQAAIEHAGGEHHVWTPEHWADGTIDRALVPGLREAA